MFILKDNTTSIQNYILILSLLYLQNYLHIEKNIKTSKIDLKLSRFKLQNDY